MSSAMDQENPVRNHKRHRIKSDIDGSWAWVVLSSTMFVTILGGGQIQSVHIYYAVFLREFKTSSSFTAWIPAAQNTAMCVCGPLASLLLPKLGARLTINTASFLMVSCFILAHFANSIPYLIIIYAFIGASQSFFLSGSLAAISMYFRKRAPVAVGAMLAGAGIGSMLMGVEIEWAIETFGWRGAMFIQAGIALHICICGSLVFSTPRTTKVSNNMPQSEIVDIHLKAQSENFNIDNNNVKKPNQEWLAQKQLFFNFLFWICVLSYVTIQGNFSILQTIFKRLAIYYDLDSSFKTFVTALGLGNMTGRMLSGTISGLVCPPIHIFFVGLLGATTTMLFLMATVPWAFTVLSFSAGFCQGQLISVFIIKLAWLFGQQQMPVVRGYVAFFGIISGLSFPPIAGYTFDKTGHYAYALIMAASSHLFSGSAGIVTYFIHKAAKNKQGETQSDR